MTATFGPTFALWLIKKAMAFNKGQKSVPLTYGVLEDLAPPYTMPGPPIDWRKSWLSVCALDTADGISDRLSGHVD